MHSVTLTGLSQQVMLYSVHITFFYQYLTIALYRSTEEGEMFAALLSPLKHGNQTLSQMHTKWTCFRPSNLCSGKKDLNHENSRMHGLSSICKVLSASMQGIFEMNVPQ